LSVADRINAGASWQSIADRLDGDGVPTARGGATWRPSIVRSAYLTRRAELEAHVS
jgi:hypothetical protein